MTTRNTARVAGWLYLATFATSIPALALKTPALDDTQVILGTDHGHGLALAGLLEMLLAVACVGTAVVLFPVIRRRSEVAAVGFLASRTLEAAVIILGMTSLLALLSLGRDAPTGADEATLLSIGAALVAVHDWAFLLGPGTLPVVNALCLGIALHRSGLVPRVIPTLGLLGAPLLLLSTTASLFGLHDQVGVVAAVGALPIALWELSLGLWLVIRGFDSGALERLGLPENAGGSAPLSPC